MNRVRLRSTEMLSRIGFLNKARLLLLLSFASLCGLIVPRMSADDVGEPAPRFTAKTLDGEKFNNDLLKGKVVLLDFWATWCPPCKKDEPAVESLIKDFSAQGLVVLSVNMGEPRRKVKKYLEQSPRSAKIVLADDTNLAAIYAARSYPTYVVIDRDGKVAGFQHGAGGEGPLRRLLAKAGLNEQE